MAQSPVISRSLTMPVHVFDEIDAVANELETSRSELLRRVWREWRNSAMKQAALPEVAPEQPRVVVVNGVTYTQTEAGF